MWRLSLGLCRARKWQGDIQLQTLYTDNLFGVLNITWNSAISVSVLASASFTAF